MCAVFQDPQITQPQLRPSYLPSLVSAGSQHPECWASPGGTPIELPWGYQLLFQVCRTSVSWILCLSACSSRKSNMYLMAKGRALPRCTVLNKVSNKSSTNFCRVPCGSKGGSEMVGGWVGARGQQKECQMVSWIHPTLEICLKCRHV